MAHYHGDFKAHYFDLRTQPELLRWRLQTTGGYGPTSARLTTIGVGLGFLGAAVLMFGQDKLFGQPLPKTMSKEWKAAEAKRFEEENMWAIRNHKIGTKAVCHPQTPNELQE